MEGYWILPRYQAHHRVVGKSIWQLQEDDTPVPAIVSKRVDDTVRLLHNENIVFGDLQDPNVLYVDSDDSVVLIDFDWAGTDGVSRYPATLNPANAWVEDVFPYGIMCKAHDIWQLKRLADLCNPDV